jgi:hypothetical protein
LAQYLLAKGMDMKDLQKWGKPGPYRPLAARFAGSILTGVKQP